MKKKSKDGFFKQFHQKYIEFLRIHFPKIHKDRYASNELKAYYLKRIHKPLSLENPKSITEKLFWLNRYWQSPLVVQCADKYEMREYIKEKNCEELLVPLYGVYDDANEIDFDSFPSSFVLKCNHGCGYNILCHDKNELNIENTINTLNTWMGEIYGIESYEYHYAKIQPKILCEKFLDFESEKSIIDYKLHCINGKPQFFLACADRDPVTHKLTLSSYSLEWERKNYLLNEANIEIARPQLLEDMIKYASILAKPFPYVRIDFYYVGNKIYIGEFTFTPAGNVMNYYKESTLNMMGETLVLPERIS